MMDKNNLGSFNSLQELWEAHPEGGHEGDYATVNGVVFRWNKYNRIWSGTGTPMETYGRKTDVHEGDVVINNDLTVAGMIRARGVKQPNKGLFHDLASLQKRYPFPEVGWWATVGDSVPGQIYRCDQPGVWSATGETGGLDSVDYEKINKIEQLLQEGYTFMGVATPETNPGTPDQKVFYIAYGKGVYANFGGLNVNEDEVVLLTFDDTWGKSLPGIASNSKLTDLEKKVGEVYDGVTNVISISKHEDDVKHLIDVSNVTTEGYVDPDNGSINSASGGMYYTSIDVKKGDVVKIKNTVGSVVEYYYMRFIAAFDSNGDVIQFAGVSTATYEYVVPEGVIKLMPTFYKITPKVEIEITRREIVIKSSVKDNAIPYESLTKDAKERLKSPFVKVKEDVNISTIETILVTAMSNGYMAPNCVPSPDASGYKYTPKIGVKNGDIISFQNGYEKGHQDTTPRFICAYDVNENPIESKGSNGDVSTMVITEDVHYIVVTAYADTTFTGINILKSSVENKEDQHFQLLRNYGYQYTGELLSGQICSFPLNTLKDKKNIAISSVFTAFNYALRIGRLHAGSSFPYIDINATNVTVVNEFRTLTKAHGLNIDKDLQVFIRIKDEATIDKLIIVSQGVSADLSKEDWRWFGNFGEPCVQAVGMDLQYISIGWSASAFNQDIWICGDSYTSKALDRWVGYLYENNLDGKIAVMGYSGSKSPEQYVSLCNLLNIHKPKFVIWCLGMNEEDNNAVNAQWKTYLDAVVSLCKLYGINLILATIPCVPSIDNTYKNTIVKSSGYRYIDFAKAVNAENAGATWYSGMLSSDNVHPSETGAKALFYQAISDVPEMLSL